MSTPPNDRETLQQLLANAFAVQESRIDPHSLTAIMQIQRLLATGKLDVDSVMAHIVDSARHVSNASGIAVALLKRDHLTYRAGSGTSAALIGLQVTASLTVSPGTKTNCEILRVENAQTDTRIEADICRQFGANALLIVPIYQNGALAGVLDVRFCEPHAFQVPEIRAYRLMAEQIEAALFHAAQFEQAALARSQAELEQFAQNQREETQRVATDVPPVPDAFEENLPDDFVPPPDFTMLPENEHSLFARCGAVLSDIMQLPVFKQSAWLFTSAAQRAKSLHQPRRTPVSTEAAVCELPPQEIPQPELATQKLDEPDLLTEELPAQPFAAPPLSTQELPQEAVFPLESFTQDLPPAQDFSLAQDLPLAQELSPAQELPHHESPQELPAIPQASPIPATPAWRTRTSAWRENLRSTADDASKEFFSTFKHAAASAALLAQRARKSTLPDRLRTAAQDASAGFSSTLNRAAASAAALSQRARNSTLPERLRRSAQRSARSLAVEVSSVRQRAASSAALLTRRAKNSNWPDRLRTGSRDAASEFSSLLKRAASSASLLKQRARARGLRWPNASRDLAMAAAVVFAFTTVLAYRSRGPAKPMDSSASPSAVAAVPQPQLPKPAAAVPDPSPSPLPVSAKTTARPGNPLKRVQVGPNEVDYVGDDVTIRTFPDHSRAKRPRLAATHTAQYGDDVTVRYFTPQSPTAKTANR